MFFYKKGTNMKHSFTVKQIGVIQTPYINNAPYQPLKDDQGEFRIVLEKEYTEGLSDLCTFCYIYVIYYIHRLTRKPVMIESPDWTHGTKVGLFASRSPARPNPIGISIVRIKEIV